MAFELLARSAIESRAVIEEPGELPRPTTHGLCLVSRRLVEAGGCAVIPQLLVRKAAQKQCLEIARRRAQDPLESPCRGVEALEHEFRIRQSNPRKRLVRDPIDRRAQQCRRHTGIAAAEGGQALLDCLVGIRISHWIE